MSGPFYSDVNQLAKMLIAGGRAPLGNQIRLAVEAGSTGSEVLMRLRTTLQEGLRDGGLSDDERGRVTALLDGIHRVL